jgi:DNA-binding NarL/FixJ family response regulator
LREKTVEKERARVFIVDDNDVVRRVLSGIIRQDENLLFAGEAASGEVALEVVRRKSPDVICLDMMLPGMDGLTVLEKLREVAPHARVVMITGYPTADLVDKARGLGAAGFVVKPFSAGKVLSTLHAALAARAAS